MTDRALWAQCSLALAGDDIDSPARRWYAGMLYCHLVTNLYDLACMKTNRVSSHQLASMLDAVYGDQDTYTWPQLVEALDLSLTAGQSLLATRGQA